jgi:hypothetical protein
MPGKHGMRGLYPFRSKTSQVICVKLTSDLQVLPRVHLPSFIPKAYGFDISCLQISNEKKRKNTKRKTEQFEQTHNAHMQP